MANQGALTKRHKRRKARDPSVSAALEKIELGIKELKQAWLLGVELRQKFLKSLSGQIMPGKIVKVDGR